MKHPPYHLRPNKAIDRFLLVELLRALGAQVNWRDYTYYGFGGPFLDDLRLLRQWCPELGLVSIERNRQTYRRQKFHRVARDVVLINKPFGDYLKHDFETDESCIVWLDYTDMKYKRFDEFMELLRKVGEESIVKITLRAQLDTEHLSLAERFLSRDLVDKLRGEFVEDFRRRYDQVLPETINWSMLRRGNFVRLVQCMVRLASQLALPASSGLTYQVLNSCYYCDQTEMVSVTGIVCDCDRVAQFRRALCRWRFADLDWENTDRIDVPLLSVKERLLLERYLPIKKGSGKSLVRALGYRVDDSERASLQKMQRYQQFYPYYPQLAKVAF